ncbi:MAG: hypothetical protein AAF927_17885 [Bacteroidota bacterium]
MKSIQSSDRLFVYPITEASDLDIVHQITYETYLRRGICKPNPSQRLVHNPALDASPNTRILVARYRGEIQATLSVSLARKAEEIYNYETFAEDLALEPVEEGLFFSGWRLAVRQEGPSSRFLVLQLILKGIQLLLQEGATFGYMSFREEHLRFYKRILPEGYLIGRRNKKTNLVDTELCMWKCYLSEERFSFLNQLVLRLSER